MSAQRILKEDGKIEISFLPSPVALAPTQANPMTGVVLKTETPKAVIPVTQVGSIVAGEFDITAALVSNTDNTQVVLNIPTGTWLVDCSYYISNPQTFSAYEAYWADLSDQSQRTTFITNNSCLAASIVLRTRRVQNPGPANVAISATIKVIFAAGATDCKIKVLAVRVA